MRALPWLVRALAACAAVTLWIAVREGALDEIARRALVAGLARGLGASVELGAVAGVVAQPVVLSGLSIRVRGQRVLTVPRLELEWQPWALLTRHLVITRLTAWTPRVRVRPGSLAPGAEGTGAAPEVQVDRLELHGARGEMAVSGTGLLRVHDLEVVATARLGAERSGLHVMRARWSVDEPGGATMEVAGRVAAEAGGIVSLEEGRLVLGAATIRRFVPSWVPEGDVAIDVTARGPWSRPVVHAAAELAAGGSIAATAALDLEKATTGYEVDARATDVDPASLVHGAPPGRLTGRVHLAGEGLNAEAPVRAEIGLDPGSLGTVAFSSAAAHVRGPRNHLEVTVRGTLPGTPAVTGRAHATIEGTQLVVREALVQRGRTKLRASGSADIAAQTVDLVVTGDGELTEVAPRLAGRVHAAGVVRGPFGALRGRADVTVPDPPMAAALSVEQTDSGFRGVLERLSVELASAPRWMLEHPARFEVADGVKTAGLTLVAGAAKVLVRGGVSRAGSGDLSVGLTHVALAPWCATAGGTACAGRLDGEMSLKGSMAAPEGRIAVRIRDASVEGQALGDVDLTADVQGERMRLHGAARRKSVGAILVEGTIGGGAGGWRAVRDIPLAIGLRASEVGLQPARELFPEAIRAVQGRVRVDARIGGTLGHPEPSGVAELEDGRIELVAAGIAYERIHARFVTEGSGVRVRFEGSGGDGRAIGEGTLDLRGDRELSGLVRLERFFAVRRAGYEATVSGTVTLGGRLGAPEVDGEITMDQLLVHPAALPSGARDVALDPTIVVLGAPEAEVGHSQGAGPLLETVRVRAAIHVPRNAWARRGDADIEFRGDVVAEKPVAGAWRATGELQVVRGWYTFQGRRFTLSRGTMTFVGASPPDPELDVLATCRVPGYDVAVELGGTLQKPVLTLSSEPLLDEADILALILFGRKSSDLGGGEQVHLGQQAAGLAAAYVMPELRESVMQQLGIDMLAVESQGEAETGEVTIGRYLSDDFFVSLGQEFGTRAGQVVSIDYRLTRRFTLRATTRTQGASRIEGFWQWRY